MKLRIKGNSIRLRLTKSEIDALRDGGLVEESVHFSATSRFTYALERSGEAVSATFHEGRVLVRVSNALALELCDTDRVGIDESAGEVRILIEKDWQCLAPRDEDESDAFPHPRAK